MIRDKKLFYYKSQCKKLHKYDFKVESLLCTYSFERSWNDDNIFSLKKKLICMSTFRALQIYNL